MPKDTFFNLDESKRKRITGAAVDELARVPISKMSINKIVQDANISRGSFYQYFEDKNDLIQYLLLDYINVLVAGIYTSIKEYKGDIFAASVDILNGAVAMAEDTDYQRILGNIFSEVRANTECSMDFAMEMQDKIIDIFVAEGNREILKTQSDEEVRILANLLFSILKDNVARCFYDMSFADKIKSEFAIQLKIIEQGAKREKV